MLTRKDYMAGKASFEDYYRELSTACGISFDNSSMLPRVKRALVKGDNHLNSIPLRYWDCLAAVLGHNPMVRLALKQRGDFFSLSVGVCMLKAAARLSAEKV